MLMLFLLLWPTMTYFPYASTSYWDPTWKRGFVLHETEANHPVSANSTTLISLHQEKSIHKDQINKKLMLWYTLYVYLYSFCTEVYHEQKDVLKNKLFLFVKPEIAWFLSNSQFL